MSVIGCKLLPTEQSRKLPCKTETACRLLIGSWGLLWDDCKGWCAPVEAHGLMQKPRCWVCPGSGVGFREEAEPLKSWFIIGFFLAAIPWYVGAFILLCARYDPREKPGYVMCVIAAILSIIAIIFGATRNDW